VLYSRKHGGADPLHTQTESPASACSDGPSAHQYCREDW